MAGLKNEYDDILALIRADQNRIYYEVTCKIDVEGTIYEPVKVTSVIEDENYTMSYSPKIIVSAFFKGDVYSRFIYPNRKNAKVILSKRLMAESSDDELAGFKDNVATYRMIDMVNEDIDMQGLPNTATEQSIVEITFALLDLTIEQLRMMRVGGIWHSTPALNILRYLLGQSSESLTLPDEQKPRGVDVVPADVSEVRSHIVVAPGTELLSELPTILQNNEGGIYNHGINIFLKNGQWFVFPMFNVNRLETTKYTIEMVILPPNMAPGIERTYVRKDGKLLLSVTGKVKQRDATDVNFQNQGNALMFAKASDLWDYGKISGNKSTLEKSNNMAEIVSMGRSNGLQNTAMSDRMVTDNPAREFSKLSAMQGYTMSVTWHNSNPALIRPVMPVRIHLPVEGGSRELKAIVLSVESNTAPVSEEMTARRCATNTLLTLFVSL